MRSNRKRGKRTFSFFFFLSFYQGTSCPSHAKNFPLSSLVALLTISSSCLAPLSLLNSFPSGTFLWKGFDKSVSQVPGCSRMAETGALFRASSMESVLFSWLRAVLDAR